jgi:hypothetical protein
VLLLVLDPQASKRHGGIKGCPTSPAFGRPVGLLDQQDSGRRGRREAAAAGRRQTVGRPAGACRRRRRRLGYRAAVAPAAVAQAPATGDEAGWTLVRDVEPQQQRLSNATTKALKTGCTRRREWMLCGAVPAIRGGCRYSLLYSTSTHKDYFTFVF